MREDELANLDDMNKNRRYSYSDLLEEPRAFDMLYRLWVIGTNRIFVWGDPDYARRFGHSTQFGDAAGFEVTAPLSLKGGHFFLQDERWPLFEEETLRHYEYEDERYWAWYRLFGRLGYSTDTDSDVWERAFERRFGEAAPHVETAYRAASKVLPLITAAHLTSHPALSNWAELDTGGALFAEHNYNSGFGETTYANTEPSDPGLFYGIDEYVDDQLAGEFDQKYTPLQIARWYAALADMTRAALEDADAAISEPNGEYDATALDLRMLADLAEYHAEKTKAAVALTYYQETDDLDYLREAYAHAETMLEGWESLAERGSGTYHDDLVFGMGPASADEGNWSDRLAELEADLDALEDLLGDEDVDPADAETGAVEAQARERGAPFDQPTMQASVPETVEANTPVEITVETGELTGLEDLTLHYRHSNQTEGAFNTAEMTGRGRSYRARVPAEYVTAEWDLLVYVSARDEGGNAVIHPGLYHAEEPEPYYIVEVTD
jgi:hypothetical protein